MKKQITYLIITFAVVLIGVVLYMGFLQKKAIESSLERIPASKPHSHVSPDGDVVKKHTHTSVRPPTVKPKSVDLDSILTKHSILRVWDNLNLADIKRKYQPFTVQEMMEKWEEKYKTLERIKPEQMAPADAYMPKAKWLQHLLDHGYPFKSFGYYMLASRFRYEMPENKERYDNPEPRSYPLTGNIAGYRNPETRSYLLSGVDLPDDATWEEFEEVRIKWNIVARLNEQRAEDVNPSIAGGMTNLKGVFTPFSPNTVYVHVSEDKPMSTFTGVMLSEQQQDDLTMFGIAPKGISVVYTDEDGNPLPADAVPRFYERKMAALEAAEAHVEKLIAEHDALFKTLPKPTEKTVPEERSAPSQQTQQGDTRTHQSEGPALQENNRRPTLPIDRHNIPPEMLPSEPPSRANMQEWFEVLQELHGGELPKDLRVLQAAIHELEEIRQAEADRIKQQRTSPSRPPDSNKP